MPTAKRTTTFALFAFAALLFALITLLPGLISQHSEYYGLEADAPAPELELLNSQVDQGLRLVVFGYSGCGTVCPVQLANLLALQGRLADLPIEFVFVTLDPERDQASDLLKNTAALGPKFTASRPASNREAQNLALAYGGYAAQVNTETGYEFDHSMNIYVLTTDWQRKLIYPSPRLDLDRTESDLRQLITTLNLG